MMLRYLNDNVKRVLSQAVIFPKQVKFCWVVSVIGDDDVQAALADGDEQVVQGGGGQLANDATLARLQQVLVYVLYG